MTEDPRGIFVFTREGDLLAFPSLSEAAAYMEAIDVANGEYPALFTIDGRVVAAATPNNETTLTVTSEPNDSELNRRLLDYRRKSPQTLPEDRIALANALLRWHWEHRWPKRPRWLARRLHGTGPSQL